ncbi:hypothetical protein [Paenibacillus elgii]|uniref:hypothetical protein n=1 Tax=Paenibacillus elgii TaxID=189691 RepID=UPI0013CFD7B3|nr:hypothetical protein [Paenibacillus elgii]
MTGMVSNGWMLAFQALFALLFIAGSALLWFPLLGRIRFGRASRLAMMLETLKRREHRMLVMDRQEEALSPKARAFAEKARLAGLPADWGYQRFRLLRAGLALMMLLVGFMAQAAASPDLLANPGLGPWFGLGLKLLLCTALGWWTPLLFVHAAAAQKRTGYLLEIAKLSQRLSICVSEKADIREMLIRAGRPLNLLKPHLQELTVMWGKDQRAAIWRFKEAVGISEVFPLVNALDAVCQADTNEMAKVLKEQTASIEATLTADIQRKLENSPIWISFYIMIPFAVIVLLFLYPWIVTISEQLMTSFEG